MSSNNSRTSVYDVLIAYKWGIVIIICLVISLIGFGVIEIPEVGLSDAQKILLVGTTAATVIFIFPAYIFVLRNLEQEYEFVQVLNHQSDETRVLAAPPEKVEEIEFERGDFDDLRATGARWNIVREFDEEEMVAVGNDLSVMTERELRDRRAAVKGMRDHLTELADVGRRLRALAPSMAVISDHKAIQEIERNIRDALSKGDIDEMLLSESEYERIKEEVNEKDTMTEEEIREQLERTDSESNNENESNGGDD